MSFNSLCKGLAIGAALMYIFDPKEGRRRRQAMRGCVDSCVENTEHALSSASDRVTDISRTVTETAQSYMPDRKKASALNRILRGAAGGAMAAYGLKKRGVLGATMGTVGWKMVAQGLKTSHKKSRHWIQ